MPLYSLGFTDNTVEAQRSEVTGQHRWLESAVAFVGSPLVGSDLFIANTDRGLGPGSLTLRNVIL